MLKKVIPVTMSGTLDDLFKHYPGSTADLGRTDRLNSGAKICLGVAECLAEGHKILPAFRIPSADNGRDVFFNNRELLCRYASMPTPCQGSFLKTLRAVFKSDDKPEEIRIEVQWSKNNKRTIQVTSGDHGDDLNFDLI